MIIHTHVNLSSLVSNKEETKPVIKENNHKRKNKKIIPTPIVEEQVVVEEKVEDEDLSKWLEEHTEN